MDTVLEQFISADKSRKVSNAYKNVSIGLAAFGLIIIFGIPILGIALEIAAAALFVTSYLMYVDFEYEMYEGNITITKVYNASRRKIAQRINKDRVKRVYLTQRKDAFRRGATSYYNTNINGLNIYTFELNDNKVVQVALNEELEKMVKIIYRQVMTY